MIYSNCFQILARSRNFLRPIIVLSQRTQRYATIPYLCVLFTLRKSSNFSAHRLSSFLPFSSTIQLFQLSDLLLRPIATQWTTRPTFDHRPSRTGHILSLARSYAAFSLSLSLSLSLSFSFLHPSFCPTLSYTHKHARIHSTTCGLSILLDPFRCRRFLLDFTRLHRNRISTTIEATFWTILTKEGKKDSATIADNYGWLRLSAQDICNVLRYVKYWS